MNNVKIKKDEYLEFVSGNKEMLYRIAFGYLHDSVTSLDAVDEAIYLGFIHLKSLKEKKYLKTWLVRILINECLKILRRKKREIVFDVIPEEGEDFEDDSIHLKIAIDRLDEDLKKVIVLRYFGGFTISQTAQILDIPPGTVSTRTKRALDELKVELSLEEGVSYDE